MPMQATPQNLQQIWNLPVGAFNPGLRQFEQMQEMDSQKMAADAAAEAYRVRERPLTLEQLAGQNRNRNAELPGIQARSRISQNEADFSDNTFDARLASWYADNKDKIQKSEFESALRAGPLLLQFAERAAYNPSEIPQMRQKLADLGAWNPEWDKANPRDVSAAMYDFGTSLSNATPAMQKLMAQLESKEGIASENNATKVELQQMRQAAAANAARIKASVAGGGKASASDKRKLENDLSEAIRRGDTEMADYLMDAIKYIQREPYQKPTIDVPGLPMKDAPRTQKPIPPGKGPVGKTGDKLPDGSILIVD